MVGQQFVDTGVRDYKGGTTKLIMVKDILEAALNIHSVEAWHSSRIRSLRRGGIQSVTAPKLDIPDKMPATAPLPNKGARGAATVGPYDANADTAKYPAENNVTQAGVNVQTVTTVASATAGVEALQAFERRYDESHRQELRR